MRLKYLLIISIFSTQLISQEKQLDIEGGMKIGHIENDPAEDTEAGTIRWNPDTDDFEGWDGTEWKSLTQNTQSTWYPPATERCQFIASDGNVNDNFGISIGIFENTAIIGAYTHDTNGNNQQGKAYIFEREGKCWVEKTVLTSLGGMANDLFGSSVDIVNEYAIVGAPFHDTNGIVDQGKAYIFEKPSDGWPPSMTQTSVLVSNDGGPNDRFATSVSISGNVAIVGAPRHDTGGEENQGKVYLFEKPTSGWPGIMTQSSNLTANNGVANELFGSSISISNDVLVVSGFQDKVYVFEKPDSGWPDQSTESATLISSDGAYSFGRSVFIEDDVVVVGAPFNDTDGLNYKGKAYVFEKPNSGWSSTITQTADLVAQEGSVGDRFGISVAISGRKIVVGAYFVDCDENIDQGSAYIFEQPAGGWSGIINESAVLRSGDGGYVDQFGIDVAISDDIVLVGANGHEVEGNNGQGKAYIFIKN